MVTNIVICGVGGQGILLAAKIIACAAELAGYEVSTNELHGMAQRGGSVTAKIRYGERVQSPLFADGEADVLASLEACEGVRNAHLLKKDGLAAVAATRVIPVTVSGGKAKYPEDVEKRLQEVFTHLKYIDCAAEAEKLGDPRLANTVLLGALSTGLKGIPLDVWRKAVGQCVKPQYVASNMTAFEQGRKA